MKKNILLLMLIFGCAFSSVALVSSFENTVAISKYCSSVIIKFEQIFISSFFLCQSNSLARIP